MSPVVINLAGGAEIAITSSGFLVVQQGLQSVRIGKASCKEIEKIQDALERLKVLCGD